MKNLKKYFVLATLAALLPMSAMAAVSVKDTTSEEFLYNQGYSKEVKRIVDVQTKDPATPIPKESKATIFKQIGWKIIQTIDPSVDAGNVMNNHSIKYYNSVDDL